MTNRRMIRAGFQCQSGLSLVEVMVSLAIGLVITGAVVVTYLSTSSAGRLQTAYSEMNENAQLALGVLSRDLALAGYSAPNPATPTVTTGTGAAAVTTLNRNYTGRAVFGCASGFADSGATGEATCNAAVAGPALEVSYEADTSNTIPTTGASALPTDCLRNTVVLSGGIRLVRNRYYVAQSTAGKPELHCASNSTATGQPIVENVEAIAFWYGQANAASPRAVVRYVGASNVVNTLTAADWLQIVSVRVCVVVRSSEAVLTKEDGDYKYRDCSDTEITVSDRIPRRAYYTTATLRNRMAF